MVSKNKKIYLLLFLNILIFLFFFWYTSKNQENNTKTSEPIIAIHKNHGTIELEIKGINSDNISLMSRNKLYMANIRFIEQLEKETTEMSAEYDETTDTITIFLTVDRGEGGTVQGPLIIFTMDCKNYQILTVDSIKYNEQEVSLEERDMLFLAKLSLQIMKLCESTKVIEELL